MLGGQRLGVDEQAWARSSQMASAALGGGCARGLVGAGRKRTPRAQLHGGVPVLARRSSGGMNQDAKDRLLGSSPPALHVAASLQRGYKDPWRVKKTTASKMNRLSVRCVAARPLHTRRLAVAQTGCSCPGSRYRGSQL